MQPRERFPITSFLEENRVDQIIWLASQGIKPEARLHLRQKFPNSTMLRLLFRYDGGTSADCVHGRGDGCSTGHCISLLGHWNGTLPSPSLSTRWIFLSMRLAVFPTLKVDICNAPKAPNQARRRIKGRGQAKPWAMKKGRGQGKGMRTRTNHGLVFSLLSPTSLAISLCLDVEYAFG